MESSVASCSLPLEEEGGEGRGETTSLYSDSDVIVAGGILDGGCDGQLHTLSWCTLDQWK